MANIGAHLVDLRLLSAIDILDVVISQRGDMVLRAIETMCGTLLPICRPGM